jgi:uncharacterized protein YbaR (Trm112 family)
MKKELMDILACPVCKGELKLEIGIEDEEDEEIIAGTLYCEQCNTYYHIEDGIPNLLPPNRRT